MKVRAEFYSRLKEIVGAATSEIELADNATVMDLVQRLFSKYPKLRDFENSMLFGIGVDFVDKRRTLREGDVIAIMPPVQGG
ncbi:MAG: molybdopterin synthase sulfur carrier subunit [Verrucomicrobiota bacterium]|jgi:MoaD family protein